MIFILQDFDFDKLLFEGKCSAIEKEEKPLSFQESKEALEFVFIHHKDKANRWIIKNIQNTLILSGKFFFSSYQDTFAFISAIYLVAIRENYYPDITFGDGFAYVSLFTIKLQGLHKNDFIMMVKIEHLMKNAANTNF